MVGIVVHDGDAADLALVLEPAIGAAEGLKACQGLLPGDAQLVCHGDGCQRVSDVVIPHHMEGHPLCGLAAADQGIGSAARLVVGDIGCGIVVRALAPAEGDESAAGEAVGEIRDVRDVSLDD